MSDLLLQILGFACVGHLVTDFITNFDLPELPNKPFRCDMCMTYWISIIPLMAVWFKRCVIRSNKFNRSQHYI